MFELTLEQEQELNDLVVMMENDGLGEDQISTVVQNYIAEKESAYNELETETPSTQEESIEAPFLPGEAPVQQDVQEEVVEEEVPQAVVPEDFNATDEQLTRFEQGEFRLSEKDLFNQYTELKKSGADVDLEKESLGDKFQNYVFEKSKKEDSFFWDTLATGLGQRQAADDGLELLTAGEDFLKDPKNIEEFMEGVKILSESGESSDDMKAFNEAYESADGNGAMKFFTAMAKNPEVALSTMMSSMVAMSNNASALAVAGGVAAAPVTGGASAAVGIGVASGILDSSLTLIELMQEKLAADGKEWNEENVKALIKSKDFNAIRGKAALRGGVIGIIDGATGGIAGKAAKAVSGVSKASKVGAIAVGGGVEAVGGALGETAGRLAIGQELDAREIGLEAVGEGPGTVLAATRALASKHNLETSPEVKPISKYELGGQVVDRATMKATIENATPQELLEGEFNIENDNELSELYSNKVSDAEIEANVDQSIPKERRDQIIDLEKKAKVLKDKDSESAKIQMSDIKSQIKDLTLGVEVKNEEGKTVAKFKKKEEAKAEPAEEKPAKKLTEKEEIQGAHEALKSIKDDKLQTSVSRRERRRAERVAKKQGDKQKEIQLGDERAQPQEEFKSTGDFFKPSSFGVGTSVRKSSERGTAVPRTVQTADGDQLVVLNTTTGFTNNKPSQRGKGSLKNAVLPGSLRQLTRDEVFGKNKKKSNKALQKVFDFFGDDFAVVVDDTIQDINLDGQTPGGAYHVASLADGTQVPLIRLSNRDIESSTDDILSRLLTHEATHTALDIIRAEDPALLDEMFNLALKSKSDNKYAKQIKEGKLYTHMPDSGKVEEIYTYLAEDVFAADKPENASLLKKIKDVVKRFLKNLRNPTQAFKDSVTALYNEAEAGRFKDKLGVIVEGFNIKTAQTSFRVGDTKLETKDAQEAALVNRVLKGDLTKEQQEKAESLVKTWLDGNELVRKQLDKINAIKVKEYEAKAPEEVKQKAKKSRTKRREIVKKATKGFHEWKSTKSRYSPDIKVLQDIPDAKVMDAVGTAMGRILYGEEPATFPSAAGTIGQKINESLPDSYFEDMAKKATPRLEKELAKEQAKKKPNLEKIAELKIRMTADGQRRISNTKVGGIVLSSTLIPTMLDFAPTKGASGHTTNMLRVDDRVALAEFVEESTDFVPIDKSFKNSYLLDEGQDIPNFTEEGFNFKEELPGYKPIKGAIGNKKTTEGAYKASNQVYFRDDKTHNTLRILQDDNNEIFNFTPEADEVDGNTEYDKFLAEQKLSKDKEAAASKSLSSVISMNMAKYHNGPFKQLRTWVTNGRELNNVPFFNIQGNKIARTQIHMTPSPLGVSGVKNLILQLVDNYKPADKNLSTEKEQLEWGLSQLDKWAKISEDPVKNQEWLKAKEPEMFLGLLNVLNSGLNTPGGIENLSTGAMGYVDMTSAGPQAMAMITRNVTEAMLVNLSSRKDRYDLYSIAGNELKDAVPINEGNWEALAEVANAFETFDERFQELKVEKFNLRQELKKKKQKISDEQLAEFDARYDEISNEKSQVKQILKEGGVLSSAGRAFFDVIENSTDFRKFLKNLVMTTNYAAKPVESAKRYVNKYSEEIDGTRFETMYSAVKAVVEMTEQILADQTILKKVLQQGTRLKNKEGKPFKIKSRFDGLTYEAGARDAITYQIDNIPYKGWLDRKKGIGISAYLGKTGIKPRGGDNAVTAVFAQMGESQVIRYLYNNYEHPQSHVHDAVGSTLGHMDELKLETRIAYVKNAELVDGKDWLTDTLHDNLPKDVAEQLDSKVNRGEFNNDEVLSNEYTVSTGWGGITELKPSDKPDTGANDTLNDVKGTFFSVASTDKVHSQMDDILNKAISITEGKGNYNLYNAFKHAHTDFITKNPKSEITLADVIDYFLPKLPQQYATKLKEYRSFKAEAIKIGEDNLIKTSKELKNKASLPLGYVGKVFAREFQSLPLLLELAFKGSGVAARIKELSGLSRFEQGKAKSKKSIDSLKKKYNEAFLKTRPNGKDFDSAENTFERDIYAKFNRRPSNSEDIQAEFDRKKKLVEDSIIAYKNSEQDRYVALGEIYDKVWNDKFKDAKSFDDIAGNVDKKNVEAVDFWTKEWANNLANLKDISKKYFKQEISDDLNFTPEAFVSLGNVETEEFLLGEDESFMPNLEGTISTTLDGSTVKEAKPTELEGKALNFEFDYVQQTRLYKSLLVENTTEASHEMKGFFQSPRFSSLFKTKRDADIVRERVAHYQRKSRGALFYDESTPEARKLQKAAQGMNKLFYSYVLAGPSQIVMQTVPLIAGTFVLNNGRVNLVDAIKSFNSNSDVSKFAEKANSFVQHRGLQGENTKTAFAHQSQLNKTLPRKVIDTVGGAVDYLADQKLKWTIGLSDGAVTKWALFENYKNALRKQGIKYDPNAEINEKALVEADQAVSKHHNVSDSDLKGMLYTSDKASTRAFKSLFLQFTDFAFNLKSKIMTDFVVATHSGVSKQDRSNAIKGLIHSAGEIAIYNALASFLSRSIYQIVLDGVFDDDERKKKKKLKEYDEKRLKTIRTNVVKDLIPIPFIDAIVAPYMINWFGDNVLGAEEDLAWEPMAKKWYESIGILGNAKSMFVGDADYSNIIDNLQGEMKREIYGREYKAKLSKEERELLKQLAWMSFASRYLGLGLKETQMGVRMSIKELKERNKFKKIKK